MSDKLKEVANHTRQLSKKKFSSNDSFEHSILAASSQTSSFSESSKIARVHEDLLQKHLLNNAIVTEDAAETGGGVVSHLRCESNVENSPTLNVSPTPPSHETPVRTSCTSAMIASESRCSDQGQDTPNQDNVLSSEPKLSSTPILVKQDSECTQRTRRMDFAEPAIPTESRLTATGSPLRQDDQRQSNEKTQLPPTPPTPLATTATTMATTATTTTTAIEPYVSILTHLKTPR